MKIAIVGFALSGFSFLKSIIDNKKNDNLEIDIYEKRSEYPAGLPYEDDSYDKLLNVDSDEMIYPKENKDDFKDWMEDNNKKVDPIEKMAPRIYFASFLKDKAKDYIGLPFVNIINEEVTDISVSINDYKESYELRTKDKKSTYDFIFLATGASFYQDPYGLRGEDSYIESPYPLKDKLKDIDDDSSIAVIGTSAASTDVFRYLMKNKNLTKPINFFTGENEYKIVDIPYEGSIYDKYSLDDAWINRALSDNEFINLDELIKRIEKDFSDNGFDLRYAYNTYKDHSLDLSRKAITENDQALAFCEDYFMQFTVYVADIINNLRPQDRQIFLNKYYKYLSFLGGKTPYKSMKLILKAYDERNIDIITNSKSIEKTSNGSFLLKGDRSSYADVLINCSGIETNLNKVADKLPLYNNLLSKEMIMADKDGECIAVTWPRLNPLSKKYGCLRNISITGMMVTTTDIDNNDARCIQKSAERIGKILVDDYNL